MADMKLVTVYSRDGTPEQHTRPNARDLVNGAGYSWNPKVQSTPASLAPFAVNPGKVFHKSAAQEILDRVGGKTTDDAPVADEDDDAGEAPVEAADSVDVEVDVEAADVVVAPPVKSPAPSRRPRSK